MRNADYKGQRDVGYQCTVSRKFQESNLQQLKMGQTHTARIGFNVYESINTPEAIVSGSSDNFEVLLESASA